jgi:predicted ArsR family transcriptional regulator
MREFLLLTLIWSFTMSKNLSAKQKMLATLKKQDGYNTFTTKQAQKRFGITNVAARIDELRQEGHVIYTNKRTLEDGRKISYYRLGNPTKSMVKTALNAGYSFTA